MDQHEAGQRERLGVSTASQVNHYCYTTEIFAIIEYQTGIKKDDIPLSAFQ